jgi:hypothetical protein
VAASELAVVSLRSRLSYSLPGASGALPAAAADLGWEAMLLLNSCYRGVSVATVYRVVSGLLVFPNTRGTAGDDY